MELNHEMVRLLLIEIEKTNDLQGMSEPEAKDFAKENGLSRDQLAYMVARLSEGGIITGGVRWTSNNPSWIIPGNLTFSGHEYLDNIRDPKIWAAVKEKSSDLASISLGVAVELGKATLMKHLGLS